jgi:hypothetical protein
MKIPILFFILILTSANLYSQKSFDMYKCKVEYIDSNRVIHKHKGWLYDVGDSSVIVSSSPVRNDYFTKVIELDQFNYEIINKIKLRKKWKIPKNILGGAVIGFGTGILLGNIAYSNNDWFINRYHYAIFWGVSLTIPASIIGFVAGSHYKTFEINERYQDFQLHKQTFEQYAIEKQLKNETIYEDNNK